MKIVNTTSYRSEFLAKLVRWAASELGMAKPRKTPYSAKHSQMYPVAVAEFGNRSHGAYNGHANYYANSVRVVTNPDPKWFPVKRSWCPAYTPATGEEQFVNDRLEALVQVLGHELGHIHYYRLGNGTGRGTEAKADAIGRLILRKFREQRETLLAAMGPVEEVRAPVDLAAKRANDARLKLARAVAKQEEWSAKLKRTQRTVAKHNRRVAYYTRRVREQAAPTPAPELAVAATSSSR